MYKVHVFLDNTQIMNRRMDHLPRAGDTMRFGDNDFGTVTEVIWATDESGPEGQRINLRVESID